MHYKPIATCSEKRQTKLQLSLQDAAERVGIILPPRMSNEMLDLQSKLEMMRRQLDNRDKEIASLVAEAAISKESYFTEVTALRADLIVVQSNLKRESAERAALESGFVTEENYLTIRYAAAQKGVKVSSLLTFMSAVYCDAFLVSDLRFLPASFDL